MAAPESLGIKHPPLPNQWIHKFVGIMQEIELERYRQQAKFGEQDCPNYLPQSCGIVSAMAAKLLCQAQFGAGLGTWTAILVEEVAEAVDEAAAGNQALLREELVQVAAVAVAWIEQIDKRS